MLIITKEACGIFGLSLSETDFLVRFWTNICQLFEFFTSFRTIVNSLWEFMFYYERLFLFARFLPQHLFSIF
jgi:hypothetical protein